MERKRDLRHFRDLDVYQKGKRHLRHKVGWSLVWLVNMSQRDCL
jgi:hypothetical protein